MLIINEVSNNLQSTLIIIMVISYLIGSISFGILLTKIFNLEDLRTFGSGNIGATNVLRTGNKKIALATLLLDSGKGFFAVSITNFYFNDLYTSVAALSVFIGHLFPIFHGLRGGKGVATFIGVFFAINYLVGLSICFFWLLIAIKYQISSLAALISSLATIIILVVLKEIYFIPLSILLTSLIWIKHYKNIIRLLNKTEPTFIPKK